MNPSADLQNGASERPMTGGGDTVSESVRRHFRGSKLFVAGIVTAALSAVLVQVMTGWMNGAWKFIFGSDEPAPITMVVQSPRSHECDQAWMVPGSTAPLPPPPGMAGEVGSDHWAQWAESVGGVPADATKVPTGSHLVLIVQGLTDAQVTITDLDFQVVERAPAFAGTLAYTNCGGGAGPIRWLDVDLDKQPTKVSAEFADWHPELRPDASTNSSASERRPIDFPYNLMVSEAETETFLIDVRTEACDCSWTGRLNWASQGRTGSLPIDNNGVPFRTAGTLLADRECVAVIGNDSWRCQR